MHRLHQRFRRNAGGQRINRLNNWQCVKICLRQYAVGMRHLHRRETGQHDRNTLRPSAMRASSSPFGMEENKGQKSGFVLTGHAIQQARRWHMFDNLDLESGNAPAFNVSKDGR